MEKSKAQGLIPKEAAVVLGVTASVALYKACDITRRLRERGVAVHVVMTDEAVELINPLLFQSLSGNKVYHGMFQSPDTWEVEHIGLADRAGCVLVAPATANILAKAAHGICDDLLTCVICATRAPVIFAPAMNDNMYRNKITQANIKALVSAGYTCIEPRKGTLVCGKAGVGCLADVDTIVASVMRVL